MTISGRFQILDALPPSALANSCAITRSTCDGERVLDIDFAVTNETPNGDLFVRETIVMEWAQMFGCLSPEKAEALQAENKDLKAQLATALKRAEHAEELFDKLRTYDAEAVEASKVKA